MRWKQQQVPGKQEMAAAAPVPDPRTLQCWGGSSGSECNEEAEGRAMRRQGQKRYGVEEIVCNELR